MAHLSAMHVIRGGGGGSPPLLLLRFGTRQNPRAARISLDRMAERVHTIISTGNASTSFFRFFSVRLQITSTKNYLHEQYIHKYK